MPDGYDEYMAYELVVSIVATPMMLGHLVFFKRFRENTDSIGNLRLPHQETLDVQFHADALWMQCEVRCLPSASSDVFFSAHVAHESNMNVHDPFCCAMFVHRPNRDCVAK